MVAWADVEQLAGGLPEAEPSTWWGRACFKVGGKAFVTRRPLSEKDRRELTELGHRVPPGETVVVRVEHLLAKEVLVDQEDACFDIPHLDGHALVLVELERTSPELLEEVVCESFLVCGGQLPSSGGSAVRPSG